MASSTAPRSDEELRNLAQSQIDSDISSQASPYEAEYASLGRREGNALSGLAGMFGNLMPYVQGAAQRVGQSYEMAKQGERGVFDAAFARYNQLKAGRAAEAQALAQEIGGPVATSQFNAATDEAGQELGDVASNSLLHGLSLAEAGVQESNAFAGRVFPALRSETEVKTRQYYEDQKKTVQDQIAGIKSQRGGLVDTRYNELKQQERQYALDQANLGLQKTQAAHDWYATKQGIAQENRRIKDAEDQFGTTADQNQQGIDLQKGQQTEAQREFNKTYGQNQQQMDRSWRQHQQDVQNRRDTSAVGVLDAITSPGTVKNVQETHDVPVVKPADEKHPPAGYYAQRDPKTGRVQWYKTVTTKGTVQVGSSVTDPNRAYDMVRSEVPGLSSRRAANLVRAKYGLPPTWQPHAKHKKPKGTKPPKPGRGD